MRFDMTRAITGGAAADPDPRSAPESVTEVMVLQIPTTLRGTDQRSRRLLVALEGTSGQSAQFELWALDETVSGRPMAPFFTEPEVAANARKFYQATTAAQSITVGQLREYTLNLPDAGKVYVRVTTVPAADATLKVACA